MSLVPMSSKVLRPVPPIGHLHGPPRQHLLTHTYTQLAQTVREHRLNERTRWFYLLLVTGLGLALGATAVGILLLDDSWLQLLMACSLGVIFTQFAFLGHEASHRQIFVSGRWNDRAGRILATVFVGMSYAWWMSKHTRHHANPNQIGRDPDIETGAIAPTVDGLAGGNRLRLWLATRQGYFLFPLLLLFGLNLHLDSLRELLSRRPVKGRWLELVVLALRFGGYLAILFLSLPLGLAFAFFGVQLAVFGLYMGAAFAPNHVGMPIVPRNGKLDFLTKQVRASRNVTGGWWVTAFMGGLNYQIEHHLFPSMPRPHLAAARRLVREHCHDYAVPYTETNLLQAWGIVIVYLNEVGIAARASFQCPTSSALR
jgi:fatty acid desaturase